jgi:hypothetical protein
MIKKMGQAVLCHPAHSPDLPPYDYHLFRPVKDALYGRHFADGNEIKVSVMLSEVDAGKQHWYTGSYSLLTKVC